MQKSQEQAIFINSGMNEWMNECFYEIKTCITLKFSQTFYISFAVEYYLLIGHFEPTQSNNKNDPIPLGFW